MIPPPLCSDGGGGGKIGSGSGDGGAGQRPFRVAARSSRLCVRLCPWAIFFCCGEAGVAFVGEMGCWLLERPCVGLGTRKSWPALCPGVVSRGLGRLGVVERAGFAKLNPRGASGSSNVVDGPVVGEDMR
jgi:hypothetical protein